MVSAVDVALRQLAPHGFDDGTEAGAFGGQLAVHRAPIQAQVLRHHRDAAQATRQQQHAQLAQAGYAMSPQTGDGSTIVKLMRVAMLVPVIVFAVLAGRTRLRAQGGPRPPLLPGFALGFVLLVVINSSGWLPAAVAQGGSDFSRWCLAAAIAAIGMKTRFQELAGVGFKPVALMLGETVFLAALVLALLHWAPGWLV